MFDILPNKELKAAEEAERRQMDFSREQNNQSIALSDQTVLPEIDKKSDLLKWQQELDDELYSLVLTLQGYVEKNGEYVQVQRPICNDTFIYQVVIPQCKPYLSRNLINSNFSEERILLDLKFTSNDIANAMVDGYDKYEIKFTDFDLIMRMIKNTIKAGGFRALNGWTKKTDSTVIRRLESMNETTGQEQKSKWSLFGG